MVAIASELEHHGGEMAIRILLLFGATVVASLVFGITDADTGGGSGTQERPIALHHAASVGQEWQMTVLSVTPNAEQAFGTGESCCRATPCVAPSPTRPLPPGAEGYMIGVSLRYLGAGSSSTETVVIIAIGSHSAPYPGQNCDRSDLVEGVTVFRTKLLPGKCASSSHPTMRRRCVCS